MVRKTMPRKPRKQNPTRETTPPTPDANRPGWWRHVEWTGCLPRRRHAPRIAALRRNTRRPMPQAAPEIHAPPMESPAALAYNWSQHAVPTINQHGPSCAGQAWANWLELMIRRHLGQDALKPGEQIDGYAIWKRGRELFDNGSLVGGLTLFEAFHAARDLGILPPDSIMVDIEPTQDAMAQALANTPLVQGHRVSDGWYETNPENGCLDHSKLPKPGDGGHATLLLSPVVQGDKLFWLSQNSWGPDYGYHGYFLMSNAMWQACYLGDGPATATLPVPLTAWDGWRKYVTTNPQ
jgi:hypothetical protein